MNRFWENFSRNLKKCKCKSVEKIFSKCFHAFFKFRRYCGWVAILSNPPRYRLLELISILLPSLSWNLMMKITIPKTTTMIMKRRSYPQYTRKSEMFSWYYAAPCNVEQITLAFTIDTRTTSKICWPKKNKLL